MWCVFQATCSASNWNQTKHTIPWARTHSHIRFRFLEMHTDTHRYTRTHKTTEREKETQRVCLCVPSKNPMQLKLFVQQVALSAQNSKIHNCTCIRTHARKHTQTQPRKRNLRHTVTTTESEFESELTGEISLTNKWAPEKYDRFKVQQHKREKTEKKKKSVLMLFCINNQIETEK